MIQVGKQPEQTRDSASQTKASVAFQGEPGAFSFAAAQKLCGDDLVYIPKETFAQVFEAIYSDDADFAVIPIENTLYGSVHENYDHLLKYETPIRGETTLRIEHALISKPGQQLSSIRRAFSHPVALDQCRRFFSENPQIKAVPYYDTAGSVKMLMGEGLGDAAAIASVKAAEIYGARILLEGLEDTQDNYTRFFLLSKQEAPAVGDIGTSHPRKTTLVFTAANFPGSLSKALGCFSSRHLNLTKLESRPLRNTPWEYLFYLDIAGSSADDLVVSALADLKQVSSFLKVLGSYCPTL